MKEKIKQELDITNHGGYDIPCKPEIFTYKRDDIIFLHEDDEEMQKEIERFKHHHKRTTIAFDEL